MELIVEIIGALLIFGVGVIVGWFYGFKRLIVDALPGEGTTLEKVKNALDDYVDHTLAPKAKKVVGKYVEEELVAPLKDELSTELKKAIKDSMPKLDTVNAKATKTK